jgi:hypothetical protein
VLIQLKNGELKDDVKRRPESRTAMPAPKNGRNPKVKQIWNTQRTGTYS